MAFKATERNLTGVQHATVRTKIDAKFNDVHDRLSAAYYDGGVFTQGGKSWDFGALKAADPASAKETFDKLHGLIFTIRDVAFNTTNLALPKKQQIPVEKYDNIMDESGTKIGSKAALAQTVINTLKAEGIELVI